MSEIISCLSAAGPYPELIDVQPRPMAETSRLLFPSARLSIAPPSEIDQDLIAPRPFIARRTDHRAPYQAAPSVAGAGGITGSIASRGSRRSNHLGKAQVQRPKSSS